MKQHEFSSQFIIYFSLIVTLKNFVIYKKNIFFHCCFIHTLIGGVYSFIVLLLIRSRRINFTSMYRKRICFLEKCRRIRFVTFFQFNRKKVICIMRIYKSASLFMKYDRSSGVFVKIKHLIIIEF